MIKNYGFMLHMNSLLYWRDNIPTLVGKSDAEGYFYDASLIPAAYGVFTTVESSPVSHRIKIHGNFHVDAQALRVFENRFRATSRRSRMSEVIYNILHKHRDLLESAVATNLNQPQFLS